MGTAAEALDGIVAALGPVGEERPGQRTMAEAVERAIERDRHLVVQAGTGTGKSLAYLVPAICSGKRVVVATATKALQDQLMAKDLPFLERHLGVGFSFAYLKGRSNYLCVQRAREAAGASEDQLALDGLDDRSVGRELRKLIVWAADQLDHHGTGDRAELDFEPSARAWGAMSVSAQECPGASNCPAGDVCFAEQARHEAAEADVVVVNTHLYGMHLASGGAVLPEHDVVVVDEAHQLEDIISATAGLEIAGSRFTAVTRAVRAVLAEPELVAGVGDAGTVVADALADIGGRRVQRIDGELAEAIAAGRGRLERVLAALRRISSPPPEVAPRKERALRLTTSLIDDLDLVGELPESDVAWVEARARGEPVLRLAPIDVRDSLSPLWDQATVILTSATLTDAVPVRLGMPAAAHDFLDVGSPFDYRTNARLYCARHLPDPRSEGFEDAAHDELEALIEAAGGRTLALFTSWKRMTSAVDALRPRLSVPILAQDELPKPALVARFTADESVCLFATMSFWQGIDVPGRSLSMVTIDRLPFAPPDDPLIQARRERAGPAAFGLIDVPRAATLLAQGAGRLIRSATDRGVVAVLDRRLATGSYKDQILRALPPMRRTVDRDEVTAFLRAITADTGESP